MFIACYDQVRRAGMDGVVVGLDNKSVIATLELYILNEDKRKQIFEDILMLWRIKQEMNK